MTGARVERFLDGGGRDPVILSSNDYLGLSRHPDVVEAARAALADFGLGSSGARGVARSRGLFERLESELAEFSGTDACLVFQSGSAANLGTIPVLAGPGDIVMSDEFNHASVRDGVRLSGASLVPYRHRDAGHLDDLMGRQRARHTRRGQRIVVVTDSVFGTEGTIAPLEEICTAAERHAAIVVVDDAHATGVLGAIGRGSVDHFGLGDRVQVSIGSLSKALGAVGGYVCASDDIRRRLIASSHPIVYSTMLPAVVAVAASAALRALTVEPGRVDRLWTNTGRLNALLEAAGFDLGQSQTPIIPLRMGSDEQARTMAEAMEARGVIVQAVSQRFEAPWQPRIRMIVRSELSGEELAMCADILDEVDQEFGGVVLKSA